MIQDTKKNKYIQTSKKMNKTRKRFLFNPNNPKKSFNVYIDKNPKNTIHIRYKTLDDVKDTIKTLEKLYKEKKSLVRTHH